MEKNRDYVEFGTLENRIMRFWLMRIEKKRAVG